MESPKPTRLSDEALKSAERDIALYLVRVIPPRFLKESKLDEKMRALIPRDVTDQGLCFHGKTGVGKTQMVCWMMMESLKSLAMMGTEFRRVWKFINYPAFIMELQGCYRKDKDPNDLLADYAEIPFLIIDDLGAEKPTDFVRQATYYLINQREMNCLPTIITTNFPLSYLDENIDPRIASRIAGMCRVIELTGPDRRKMRVVEPPQNKKGVDIGGDND